MPRQLDLLERPGLEIKPEAGRSEPRFWVRRLVIWSDPTTILREIVLRPGLNIVWSPDPSDPSTIAEQPSALGHGSGKTLFCRLLRYCLGEDRFAPEEERLGIMQALPDGRVGVEVELDGTRWAVLRPIGLGRDHFAIPDVSLEEILAGGFEAKGIEGFLESLENVIISETVVALMPGDKPLTAWLVALAWLSRDQECRFDKVLDWRSSESDSDSPARRLSATKLLDAVRALIGAIVPGELALRDEIGEMETRQTDVSQDSSRRAWEAERVRSRLVAALGLDEDDVPAGRMGVEPLRKAAIASLGRLAAVDPEIDVSDLEGLRTRHDEAQARADALSKALAETRARGPEIEALIRRISAEFPGASARVFAAENPICPVCDVLIDRALAEGCKLSHKVPNREEIEQRYKQLQEDVSSERSRLQANIEDQKRIGAELGSSQEAAEKMREQLKAAEGFRDARSDVWFKTRRLIDDADRLGELLIVQEQSVSTAESMRAQIETKRELTGTFRNDQAEVFNRLSRLFDGIVGEIVGHDAVGKVSLDGSGLKLSLELGGVRSTAAIDSLKIIAFDLAVLGMSIEGGTHLPAFLIHDSPREADLGLSVYHRLFRMIRKIEQEEDRSLFQYIVTTTTQPPDELRKSPWLVATLGGTPAEARLLRRDL